MVSAPKMQRVRANGNQPALEVPFVGTRERYVQISNLLSECSFKVWHAPGLSAVLERYREQELHHAVLAEERFGNSTWEDMLHVLNSCSRAPYLIVLTQFSAGRWVSMLEKGVFDVVTEPVSTQRLAKALETAGRRWEHQQENAQLRETHPETAP